MTWWHLTLAHLYLFPVFSTSSNCCHLFLCVFHQIITLYRHTVIDVIFLCDFHQIITLYRHTLRSWRRYRESVRSLKLRWRGSVRYERLKRVSDRIYTSIITRRIWSVTTGCPSLTMVSQITIYHQQVTKINFRHKYFDLWLNWLNISKYTFDEKYHSTTSDLLMISFNKP